MPDEYVLAIDQGTSSTKCVLVDRAGAVVATGSAAVGIGYPRPGWVEQDAGEILAGVLRAAGQCLAGVRRGAVAAVGLSTQRESALVWDRHTGEPLGPVLGWQDQRSRAICDARRGESALIRKLSGLPLDPMFSAAKLRWLLDTSPDALVGTVDSWLLYALTGAHQIEVGNASRTQLLDVSTGEWSPELLGLFGIPFDALPRVTPSAGELGVISGRGGPLAGLPIMAVLGDSHAALYAHTASGAQGAPGAFAAPGTSGASAASAAKVTYGTGSSVMRLVDTAFGDAVCSTIAWGDPAPRLAAEGNIRSSGATVAWLADLLGVTTDRVAALAEDASSDGVVLVPAFGGLGAPWWDDAAEGLITGLTLGAGQSQLARAALESIAHQVADVADAMGPPGVLFADGGASANDTLMQIQADLAGVPVRRARTGNLSALGAAHLAGRAAGFPAPAPLEYDDFHPRPGDASVRRAAWRAAVHRSTHHPAGS